MNEAAQMLPELTMNTQLRRGTLGSAFQDVKQGVKLAIIASLLGLDPSATAGLSEGAAAEAGILPGKAGLATTYAPGAMVEGTQASGVAATVQDFFGAEKLNAFLRLQGISGNMFATMIDSILESQKKQKQASVLDYFTGKGQ